MSRCLAERGIDHVVLERGEVANSWRTERWDSLRLLTPNWQSRLPGYGYDGDDPDGYRTMPEVVAFIAGYAAAIAAPVEIPHRGHRRSAPTATAIASRPTAATGAAASVVIATGACNIPRVPKVAEAVPAGIAMLTPMDYRNPDQLAEGGVLVVGASATGIQLADEIHRSGRPVTLAVGEHVRAPRTYRGRDIQWWMDRDRRARRALRRRSTTSSGRGKCRRSSSSARRPRARSISTRSARSASGFAAGSPGSATARPNSPARSATSARSPTSR